jgi:hypothetical protein
VIRDWLIFALVLLASGLLASGTMILLLARTLLRPTRMTDGRAIWLLKRLSPGDLRLNFEDLKFHVRDEQTGKPLDIAAWWIPSAGVTSNRTILLIHGYADAKVGAIAWAPTLQRAGLEYPGDRPPRPRLQRRHAEHGGLLGTPRRHAVDQPVSRDAPARNADVCNVRHQPRRGGRGGDGGAAG